MGKGVSEYVPEPGEPMKTMLKRLLILAAPFIWRKIRERRSRGR